MFLSSSPAISEELNIGNRASLMIY